ncbi:NADH-quinone oxidoreductase subunit J [Terrabacter sp. NPDC080008]|uniref:NADH-quinone oxidoreductase subunit J family protein n=1 Tax=Terrabacter sp. NPDC080008 TaxID=3155176 RepID=UPI0034504FE6
MTTRDIVFTAVGAITALSALLSVTTKHVVHAALWLLVSLGSLAGAYLVLGQELVGLVQLLVYVGAIVVLVLFALMLTRAPIGPHEQIDTPWWQRLAGALLGAATTVLLASLLLPFFSDASVDLDQRASATPQIAQAVFGTWVWPFELLSVLLLVALIGAFAVSRLVLGDGGRRPAAGTRPEPGAAGAAGAEGAEGHVSRPEPDGATAALPTAGAGERA